MNRVIINADDFGIHGEVNKAVYEGHTKGILTSTSLLAQGAAFDEAVELAGTCPRLGVGIHLCLVGGLPPVLSPREVPTLVGRDGLLPDNYIEFISKAYTGKIDFSQVYAELDAQIEKVSATELPITHLDSHQHLHVLPPVWKITTALMKKHGLHRLRLPREAYRFKLFTARPGRVVGRGGLTALAVKAAPDAARLRFSVTDYFWGMVDGGDMTEPNLRYILQGLPFGIHEIMMHPGASNDVLGRSFSWGYHWQEELAALLSPRIRAVTEARKLELINYGDLP